MSSSGNASQVPNDAYSANPGDRRSSSTSSSRQTEIQKPLGNDVEKSSPLDGDVDERKHVAAAGFNSGSFPDGGFDAWMTVAGGFCTIFSSFGWINCRTLLEPKV
jgi:hypothetical protein